MVKLSQKGMTPACYTDNFSYALRSRSRNDQRSLKHAQEYLFVAIDGLRTKEKWHNLGLAVFPLKVQSNPLHYVYLLRTSSTC